MYPRSVHFIKNKKGGLLGSVENGSKVFAFLHLKHAVLVKQKLMSDKINVKQTSEKSFMLSVNANHLPNERPQTTIDTVITDLGMYTLQVNNLDVTLIDDVNFQGRNIELLSNFAFENVTDVNESSIRRQIDKIYNDEEVDYIDSYTDLLLDIIRDVQIEE